MTPEAKHLLVGTIRKPHGLRGELVVQLDTDRPATAFRRGRELQIGEGDGRLTGRTLTVAGTRPFKGGILLATSEHASLSEVENLRGKALFMALEDAEPLGPDEVFYHDLPGMKVVHAGEVIGTVSDLVETAGPELLVVKRPEAGDLLVPMVKEMVTRVDREQRVIEIDPPPGLLEL